MKRIFMCFAMMMAMVLSVFAQVPQTMSYQGVVRDANNALVISKAVSIELSILRGSDEGDVVYAEKHDATTNANGLISLTGKTIPGRFEICSRFVMKRK